ncbi:MAG: caspase family protein [Candidatus Obscuribacterales bacterium]|nr:caspase family protein [Candidatus Obscuribacterales bacterium]
MKCVVFAIAKLMVVFVLVFFQLVLGANEANSAESALGGGMDVSWNPASTLVFVVGVLKWQDKSYLQFSTKARRDAQLVEFFKSKGVAQDRIVYLCDSEATIRNVYEEFEDLLEKSKPGDTLIFYYCGHGWLDDNKEGYYANYDVKTNDNAISTKKIASKMKNKFQGSTALFFADCCTSGSIANALAKQPGGYSWGMASSVNPDGGSTSNWTFSQALLDALNGHKFVDTNLDGVVSFSDLQKYAAREMKTIDNQVAGSGSGNGFSETSYVLAKVSDPNEQIPRLVEVKWGGRWWKAKVLETKGNQAKIRWVQIGYDSAGDDEWHPFNEVRETSGAPFNGMAVATTRNDFKVGDTVEVLWKGDFYKAKILKAEGGRFYIHYIEDDDSWDEWVDLSRMK